MTLAQLEKQMQAEQQLQEQQLQEFKRYLDGFKETHEANPRLQENLRLGSKRRRNDLSDLEARFDDLTFRFDDPGKPPAHTQIEVRRGNNGRLRIFIEARKADQRPAVIQMKFGNKYVEFGTQTQEMTVVVHPDPGHCDEWWIGGEGDRTVFFVESREQYEIDCD